MNLQNALRAAGILQIGLLFAALLVPKVLDWRTELVRLSPFLRSLFWIYGAFIALTFTGFGVLSWVYAEQLASGQPPARGLCGFVALFWTARLAVQLFVMDARPYLRGPIMKIGHHLLTVTFVFLSGVYAWAALAP